jgi:nitroreductase
MLVDRNWVLTTGHAFAADPSQYTFRFGGTDDSQDGSSQATLGTFDRMAVHPTVPDLVMLHFADPVPDGTDIMAIATADPFTPTDRLGILRVGPSTVELRWRAVAQGVGRGRRPGSGGERGRSEGGGAGFLVTAYGWWDTTPPPGPGLPRQPLRRRRPHPAEHLPELGRNGSGHSRAGPGHRPGRRHVATPPSRSHHVVTTWTATPDGRVCRVELREVVRRRRMVRAYQPVDVPPTALTRMLQHAVRAPSAGFTQGWDFLVLATVRDRSRFWVAATPPPGQTDAGNPLPEPDAWLRGLMTAPVLVVCLSDPDRYLRRYAEPDKGWTDRDPGRWPVPYWDVDTGMAAMAMLLTAVDEGLGACFFGVPPEHHAAVREAFGIPDDRRIVGVVSAGLPAPDRRSPSLRRGRRPFGEVVHGGRFGVPFPGVETA